MVANLIARLQDLFRNAFNTGKQQLQALKLTNKRSQLEKDRAKALADLGHLAWAQRVQHPSYTSIFAQLVELDTQQQAAQAETTKQQQAAQQDETLRQQLRDSFAARVEEARQQQQASAAKLAQITGALQQPQADEATVARLTAEQQQAQAEVTTHEQNLSQIKAEEEQTLASVNQRVQQAQQRSKELAAQLKQLERDRAPLLTSLGAEVLAARPADPTLNGAYQVIDEMDSNIASLQSQITALRTSGGPAALQRLALVGGGGLLLLVLLVGGVFWAMGSMGSGPRDVAQRYADAFVREDYQAMEPFIGNMPNMNAGQASQIVQLMGFLRQGMIAEYGALQRASTLPPTTQTERNAEVVIVWHLEKGDLALPVNLTRDENVWQITNMGNFIPGKLEGNQFIASGSVAPGPYFGDLPAGDASSNQANSPIITPTPSAFTLNVEVKDVQQNQNQNQITVTLVERSMTESLQWGRVSFADLPAGTYTLRVSAPGFKDTETTVEARGDRALPNPIELRLGEALPLDPNTSLLMQLDFGNYELFTTTNNQLQSVANFGSGDRILGLSADQTAIMFLDAKGLGQMNVAGERTYSWQHETQQRSFNVAQFRLRPDRKEAAYVQNNDVFSTTTDGSGTPTRWTKVGIYNAVIGWYDDDTLIVNSNDTGTHVVRRDGSSYVAKQKPTSLYGDGFGAWSRDSWGLKGTVITDRSGRARFLVQGSNEARFQQIGTDKLEEKGTFKDSWNTNLSYYGWSRDNRYLILVQSSQDKDIPGGIYAVSSEKGAQRLAPELKPASADRSEVSGGWALPPEGSEMAIVWLVEGQQGIYVINMENGAARKVSETTPDRLFWPNNGELIYVINEGSQMGTWRLPLNGDSAEKIFAYRATSTLVMPDGRILMLANNSLWAYNGSSEPTVVGTEGQLQNYDKATLIRLKPAQ
jgi:hypothetical protein